MNQLNPHHGMPQQIRNAFTPEPTPPPACTYNNKTHFSVTVTIHENEEWNGSRGCVEQRPSLSR